MPKTAFLAAITPDKIIELTNLERAKAKSGALTANPLLAAAAADKARAILETQTFDHTINGARFSAWVREAGYEYSLVGENLAIDFVTSEGVMRAWLASPSHKANLLNSEYSEIGVAAATGDFQGQPTAVIVQIFAAPAAAITPIAPAASPKNHLRQPAKRRVLGESERLFSASALGAYFKKSLAIKNTAALAVNIMVFQTWSSLAALLGLCLFYVYLILRRLFPPHRPKQAALF